jgi:predicted ArsR family transcriptional regulator
MMAPDPFARPTDLDVLADAFGDPTRRAIFLHLSETGEPETAAEIGRRFGIHRTVARAHLERLTEHGLLRSESRHRPEGGRPPKVYVRTDDRLSLELPLRRYELLVELLLGTLDQFGEAGYVLLRSMGLAFGRSLAAGAEQDGLAGRIAQLGRVGARVRVTTDEDGVHVRLQDCLFREAAERRPHLVCVLDRAIITGVFADLEPGYTLADAVRRTPEHDACLLTFVPGPAGATGSGEGDPRIDHAQGEERR